MHELRARNLSWPPYDPAGCAASANRYLSFFPTPHPEAFEEELATFYGLDVHREFVQVCALAADGKTRREFRIDATAEAIEAFAKTLGRADAVVLEATFHTWAIHSIFARFVDRVAVANPLQVRAIAHAKIKTDKIDAQILAQLLRMEFPGRSQAVTATLAANSRSPVRRREVDLWGTVRGLRIV